MNDLLDWLVDQRKRPDEIGELGSQVAAELQVTRYLLDSSSQRDQFVREVATEHRLVKALEQAEHLRCGRSAA